jgi:hypothetical protein
MGACRRDDSGQVTSAGKLHPQVTSAIKDAFYRRASYRRILSRCLPYGRAPYRRESYSCASYGRILYGRAPYRRASYRSAPYRRASGVYLIGYASLIAEVTFRCNLPVEVTCPESPRKIAAPAGGTRVIPPQSEKGSTVQHMNLYRHQGKLAEAEQMYVRGAGLIRRSLIAQNEAKQTGTYSCGG